MKNLTTAELETLKLDTLRTLGNDDLPKEFEAKLKQTINEIDSELHDRSIIADYEERMLSDIPMWAW
jgi:hypothetical protein